MSDQIRLGSCYCTFLPTKLTIRILLQFAPQEALHIFSNVFYRIHHAWETQSIHQHRTTIPSKHISIAIHVPVSITFYGAELRLGGLCLNYLQANKMCLASKCQRYLHNICYTKPKVLPGRVGTSHCHVHQGIYI